MKNLSYKKTNIDKLTIKGTLSDDGVSITYIDDDKDERVIDVDKCMKLFAGNDITLTMALKTETDEDIEENEE